MQHNEEDEFKPLSELMPDHYKSLMAKIDLREDIEKAESYYQRLQVIKKFYKTIEAEILATFEKSRFLWKTSYPFDWSRMFTPIEQMAWGSIRCKGRIVLYPQYPVLNYHIDFANPGLKIGLELDGKDFHNKDRDIIRDAELKREGWTIFRVTGKEMYRTNFKLPYEIEDGFFYEHEDEAQALEELRYWLMETGDGVIQAIKIVYFDETDCRLINPYFSTMFRQYCEDTLEAHQY